MPQLFKNFEKDAVLVMEGNDNMSFLQKLFEQDWKAQLYEVDPVTIDSLKITRKKNSFEIEMNFHSEDEDDTQYDHSIQKDLYGGEMFLLLENMTREQFYIWVYTLFCHRLVDGTY